VERWVVRETEKELPAVAEALRDAVCQELRTLVQEEAVALLVRPDAGLLLPEAVAAAGARK